MHESGQIEGRVSGKQIVYHAIQASTTVEIPQLIYLLIKFQDPNDNASEDGLKALDEEAESTSSLLQSWPPLLTVLQRPRRKPLL